MEGRTFFNPAQIVMGALVLGLLGSLVNSLLLAAERRLRPLARDGLKGGSACARCSPS